MKDIIVIAHNLRSAQNVGSLLRTTEGLGVKRVYLTGYTPYPKVNDDTRLPHMANKIDARIRKTALGAEKLVEVKHKGDIFELMSDLSSEGYSLVALEQADNSTMLEDFEPPKKLALILGREVKGIEPEVLAKVDQIVEIPMFGKKESFNVVIAAAMAIYYCQFSS